MTDTSDPFSGADATASATAVVAVDIATAAAYLTDFTRFDTWLTLHQGWRDEPPQRAAAGQTITQQAVIIGIPADVTWTVTEVTESEVQLAGHGPMDVTLVFRLRLTPQADGTEIRFDAALSGQPISGPMGATVARGLNTELESSLARLADALQQPPTGPAVIVHDATGQRIDPTTPVIVGASQLVNRNGDAPHPAAFAAQALRQAATDSGGDGLLQAADAVYAIASASWTYRDQGAAIADELGIAPAATVQSSPFGGDGGQLMINTAAQSVVDGEADVVLVAGAESGATLAATRRSGGDVDWPTQAAGVEPTEVVGTDRAANNDAEAAVGLGAPIYMYALLENAVRGAVGHDPQQHRQRIGALWSELSAVAAGNPYAWQPRQHDAEQLTQPAPGNRLVSVPYTKLLCANLEVDLASGVIVCSAAAAQRANVPQHNWIFLHAGASGHDDWFVSERAWLAESPAIRTLGHATLDHAGLSVDDLEYVDLYSCFASAVQISAGALGLPVDDPRRPLSVTGGLTFAGGPGNNYGTHAVATLVPLLRDNPSAYGLSTSLGWYVTKHALGIYSATPPRRPFAHLRPAVASPPSRPARTGHAGEGVLETYTVPYDRDGTPQAAILSVLTPDGARVLARTSQPEIIDVCVAGDPLHRAVSIAADGTVTVRSGQRQPLPEPPPPPVLVDRHGPVTVITLNRPHARNAIDPATAQALELAIDVFEADDEARVAVLTGADGSFCAGMDLKAAARGEFPMTERRGPLGLTALPPAKPLIAAVEGHALAGGCELALAADLIVAAEDASFGIPEVKRGLAAAAGGVLRLRQRLPRNLAMQLALTGEPMFAPQLAAFGLINDLAPRGQALATAIDLAERIAVNAPISLQVSKQIVDEADDWTSDMAFARQRDIAAAALLSADATEGIRAFAEKRDPVWRGR